MTQPNSPQSYLAKADRALASGGILLAGGDLLGTCDRAYFAMFHAVHALLLATGIEQRANQIKTHAGLLVKVSELVKRGHLEPAARTIFRQMQQLWHRIEHGSDSIEQGEASQAIEWATAFLTTSRTQLPALP